MGCYSVGYIDFCERTVRYVTMRKQLKQMKSLTDREREIILTLAQGKLSNRDVGRQLNLSEDAVKAHLHNIYKKLGVNKRSALAAMARTRREELCSIRGAMARF
jgi:DNA-binding CsgD family transcriptional regulator